MCKSPTAWKIANGLILHGNSVSRSASGFDNMWIPQIFIKNSLESSRIRPNMFQKIWGYLWSRAVAGSFNLDLSA